MCNNLAVIAKLKGRDKFTTLALKAKLALILGRNRGSKGTGIMHNGDLLTSHDYYYKNGRGISANHDAVDFIESLYFVNEDSKEHVIMGHNRAPSSGMGSGAEFVHPFEYSEQYTFTAKDGKQQTGHKNRMWFQHNGTITNTAELCKKFGDLKFENYKNDSKLLGHLIYSGVDVEELFKTYRGKCTCIWYWENEGVLRVFKGATLNSKDELVEERSLYMYKTKDQIWFNSQAQILNIINDYSLGENDIVDVQCNEIISIDKNLKLSTQKVDRRVKEHPPTQQITTYRSSIRQYGYTDADFEDVGIKKFEVADSDLTFPDYRKGYNQMVWYKGRYYFNGRLAHGPYRLDEKGLINSFERETYFINGYLLHGADEFFNCISGKQSLDSSHFHAKALHKCVEDGGNGLTAWYNRWGKVSSSITDIKYYPHSIKFAGEQLVSAGIHNAYFSSRMTENPIPFINPAEWLSNYNIYLGTDFAKLSECRVHYCELVGRNDKMDFNHEVDFCNICTDNREIIQDDPITDIFNLVNETNHLTRFQCQQDYVISNYGSKTLINDVVIEAFYDDLNEHLDQLDELKLQDNYL